MVISSVSSDTRRGGRTATPHGAAVAALPVWPQSIRSSSRATLKSVTGPTAGASLQFPIRTASVALGEIVAAPRWWGGSPPSAAIRSKRHTTSCRCHHEEPEAAKKGAGIAPSRTPRSRAKHLNQSDVPLDLAKRRCSGFHSHPQGSKRSLSPRRATRHRILCRCRPARSGLQSRLKENRPHRCCKPRMACRSNSGS